MLVPSALSVIPDRITEADSWGRRVVYTRGAVLVVYGLRCEEGPMRFDVAGPAGHLFVLHRFVTLKTTDLDVGLSWSACA